VNSPKKKPTTYRLTPELDQIITRKAAKLGLSKNAFVQLTLSRALEQENDHAAALDLDRSKERR